MTLLGAGFTLVELSIVLVIIGLIVGGIMVGKTLIGSSEIRAQISQIEEFKTATNTFRVKYGYMPGDMPPTQASQLGFFTFTGTYAGKECAYNASWGFQYGNNDGIINYAESLPFWSHLGDSKLIKGTYGGTAGNLLNAAAPNCNLVTGDTSVTPYDETEFKPTAVLGGSYFGSSHLTVHVQGNYYFLPRRIFYGFKDVKQNNMFYLLSTASEAYQIDSKIDDGLAATGSVRDLNTGWVLTPHDHPPCTTSGVTPIAYDLSPSTADSENCDLTFMF